MNLEKALLSTPCIILLHNNDNLGIALRKIFDECRIRYGGTRSFLYYRLDIRSKRALTGGDLRAAQRILGKEYSKHTIVDLKELIDD